MVFCLAQDGVEEGKLGWRGGRAVSAFTVSARVLAQATQAE